jgi:hypothetical protein
MQSVKVPPVSILIFHMLPQWIREGENAEEKAKPVKFA